jgi:short-subunit dehydrogenase
MRSRNIRRAVWTGAMLAAATAARTVRRVHREKEWAKSKVVVITGGSRGLGLALAQIFGEHGARVVLAARDDEELQKAKNDLLARIPGMDSDRVLTVACDLTVPGDPEKLIERAVEVFGSIDVLINNAGVIYVGPVDKLSTDLYLEAMNSNFFGMLRTTYAVLPHLLERRSGSIVNIGSIGGKIPVPHLAPYTASKFAAVGFSETLQIELRPKGIQVTTVNPGLMRTGSYPHANFVGQRKKEYRWFSFSASTPGIAHSVSYAARKIYSAVVQGRREIEVGLDAYLAARAHGLTPSLTQALESVVDELILPESGGTTVPAKGTELASS